MKYSKRIISLILAMILVLLFTSCQWFNTEEPHECESACAECGECLDIECTEEACADKCPGHHKCERVCESCEGCLDAECGEEACLEKCSCPKYVNVSEELVETLLTYLNEINTEYDLISWTTERQINEIKNGMQPLLVTFDSVNTYYVGVYFSGEHFLTDSPIEIADYCCMDNYVWVRFDSIENITRTYNNRDILTVFEIREIESVMDIRSEDASVPSFVIFEMLYRYISKEDEIKAPDLSSKSFIYLAENNTDTVYYNLDSYRQFFVYMDCILFNDEYYLIYHPDTIEYEFGEYYNELIAITDTESYWVINSREEQVYYAIIKVSDFAEVIKGE